MPIATIHIYDTGTARRVTFSHWKDYPLYGSCNLLAVIEGDLFRRAPGVVRRTHAGQIRVGWYWSMEILHLRREGICPTFSEAKAACEASIAAIVAELGALAEVVETTEKD